MSATELCPVCSIDIPKVGYGGNVVCPNCGLVWEYDEGIRPTPDSIRAAFAAAVAAERERCAQVAEAVAAENDEIAERTTSSVSTAVLHGLADAARIIAERIREAGDAVAEVAGPQHPRQPVVMDTDGVERFKANPIVRFLLEWAKSRGMNLNELAKMDFTDEDRRQFAQLIGYSVSGYHELSYTHGGRS